MTIDTGVAKLPGLPVVRVDDPALQKWMQAVAERLEVREGQRGNAKERAVTVRDLEKALQGLEAGSTTIVQDNGDLKIKVGGLNATISVEQFAESIRKTRLYRDLMKRLDDQSRFDDMPSEIRDVLLRSIAEEAALRGADIQRVETKIQDTNRSLAMVTEEITASLGNNAAGIREVQAAYVNSTQATAVKVTQLESSLGNYYQDGNPGRVILEEQLTTQASYVDGLRGQYTLKIQAGGALAGFGLAAEEINGVPASAFLIAADKFAIVAPDYSGGLTGSPPLTNIPFGVDANGVYINGQVRINATGLELQQVSRSIALTALTNVFKRSPSGAWDGDTITINANKLGGLTATPAWTVISGSYSGSLPNGNALTVSRSSMTTDVVVFRATATQDGFNYTDDFAIARLADGSNAITAILSNETHSVSADSSGNVSSYTGSGTQIRVFEGAAELTYDGSGASNGTWTVTAAGSSITPGSIADSGTYATVNAHSNFLTASDTATITYTISGKAAGGTSFSVTKTQSFSKAKTGAAGATGATGAAGSRGSQTFYASGGAWSDTTANNIVTSVTGSSTRIIGDTVVISNGSSYSETRYWSGSGWVSPGVVIDGNLLVNGTISGSKIATNTLTADKIDSRGLTIKDSAGNIVLSSGNAVTLDRVVNPINILPDDGFYSWQFWRNDDNSTAWPTGWAPYNGSNPSQPVTRFMRITNAAGGAFDYFSKNWSVAPSKQYRVRLWMYLSPDFNGFISPAVHVPAVAWAIPGNTVADPGGAYPNGHTLSSWGGTGWRSAELVYTTAAGYSYMQTRVSGRIYAGYCEFYIEVIPVAESFINQGAFATLSQITSANASTYIANAAIQTAQIGDAAITTAKIGDAQISNAKIANLAVDTIKIAGNSVTVINSAAATAQEVNLYLSSTYGGTFNVILAVDGAEQNLVDVWVNSNLVMTLEGIQFYDYNSGRYVRPPVAGVAVTSVGGGTIHLRVRLAYWSGGSQPSIRVLGLLAMR